MKKTFLLLVLILSVSVFFVSCTSVFQPAGIVRFVITNWNSGPGVEGATVEVYESGTGNLVGQGVSGALGAVEIGIARIPLRIDVKVTKPGFARSLVQGLKPEAVDEIPFGIVMKTAQLNANPATETDPVVEIGFFEIEAAGMVTREGTPIDINTQAITGPFSTKIEVTATNHIYAIYEPLIDRIAGAGLVTTDRGIVSDSTEAEFDITPIGHDGEVALYTTVYDYNGNRVLKVDYLLVEGTDPGEVAMYQPMTFADFSDWYFFGDYNLENMWTYTRRSGVSMYVDPRGMSVVEQMDPVRPSKQIDNAFVRDLDEGSRVAPDGGNLWSLLYWADWTTADAYYGAYPDELLNPGDEPDGYNLYYSLDGITYEKFGFVTEAFVSWLADTILYYVGEGFNENQVMNLFSFYKDPSIFLHPGVALHYQVTSVYGTLESTPTDLGSVVPLDSFNIELENPLDDAVDVPLNPIFKWKPTKALESVEGDVIYTYAPFIYDWVQSDNGLIVPTTLQGNMVRFTSDTADSIELPFTGVNPNIIGLGWSWYNPYSGELTPYEENTFEPNKTYNWGVNIALACVTDADSRAYSIAADYKYRDTGWYYDPATCMEPDLHAAFTTGAQ
ncbi:MAG TPA: hypothetical protein PLO55_11925 [Thermotogota bacterium]|nr:hypothetical protein [Thermotogota bacterium]